MISMRVGLLAKAKERVKRKVVMNIKVTIGCMRMLRVGWAMGMMGMMVMIRKRVNNGDD